MQHPPIHKLYIHGGYVDSSQPECGRFPAINPANGETIADLQSATLEDPMGGRKRQTRPESLGGNDCDGTLTYLRRAVDILRERNDELAYLEPLIRANRFLKLVMWISLQGRMFLNTMQV